MLPSAITCENGHVWDTSMIADVPEVRGHIVQCPMPVNGKECGGRVVWKNPAPLPLTKKVLAPIL